MKIFFLSMLLFCGHVAWACTLSDDLQHTLEQAAMSHGLEPALLQALVYQESRYCTDALSPKGAIGLGQLMPGTAQALGVDPYNPEENLYGAATYLKQQWETFGNWELALAAYNAGPGAVIRYEGIPVNGETELYVPSVLTKYVELSDAFDDNFDDSVSLQITPVVYVKPVSLAVLTPRTGGLLVYERK
ncbi:MAG: lytic transglycosylase domain-containing protein [Trueperaceae bacterium]